MCAIGYRYGIVQQHAGASLSKFKIILCKVARMSHIGAPAVCHSRVDVTGVRCQGLQHPVAQHHACTPDNVAAPRRGSHRCMGTRVMTRLGGRWRTRGCMTPGATHACTAPEGHSRLRLGGNPGHAD